MFGRECVDSLLPVSGQDLTCSFFHDGLTLFFVSLLNLTSAIKEGLGSFYLSAVDSYNPQIKMSSEIFVLTLPWSDSVPCCPVGLPLPGPDRRGGVPVSTV